MADLDRHLPAIASGDHGAYARWLAAAEPRLRATLRSFAAAADTEAILQEALLRVWQVAPRFTPDGRPDALLRFAFRTTRNLALDEVRRSGQREVDRVDAPDLEALAGEGPGGEPDPLLRRLVLQCLERLARRPRLALDARLAAGGTEPDAALAARLGMRLNTFLENVGRARKALSDCLRRRGVAVEEMRT